MATRRQFFLSAAASAAAVSAAESGPDVLGPMPGYSPQIGTLVSEMIWMRTMALAAVRSMTQAQLDFLLDAKANRIGALLLHLAATDRWYQLNTFENVSPQRVDAHPAYKDWVVPMNLGEPARQQIKGHDLDYYLNIMRETREKTLAEFRKRDDDWLLVAHGASINNLCKWFHVCEHESHHTGQIAMIAGRAPRHS
jgi:uncharacterized damage-inducible protein DinB